MEQGGVEDCVEVQRLGGHRLRRDEFCYLYSVCQDSVAMEAAQGWKEEWEEERGWVRENRLIV
jgi:hypothetical protein